MSVVPKLPLLPLSVAASASIQILRCVLSDRFLLFSMAGLDPASEDNKTSGTGDKGVLTNTTSNELPEMGIDKAESTGKLSQTILPHLLNLYNCKSSPSDYEIYAPNAVFEDPLMRAHGIKQIKSAFYSIPKVFTEARMGEYHVQELETSPGTGEIKIDNVQHYRVLGQQIDMKSLIRLQCQDWKVVRHEDLWEKRPLWSKDTVKVPLVGRFVQKLRRGNMLFTHLLMGFGKDPKPKVAS